MNIDKYEFELKTKYIGEQEGLKDQLNEIIRSHHFILFVSPQGTGKTSYLKQFPGKKALMSPTRALSDQMLTNRRTVTLNGFSPIPYLLDMDGAIDEYGEIRSDAKMVSTTYSSSNNVLGAMETFDFEFETLVVDEVHKLVQFSSFAMESVNNLIKTIEMCMKQGKRILCITATPLLLECLEEEEFYKKLDCIIEIKANRKYIEKIITMPSKKDTLMELLKQNDTRNNLQIVLTIGKEGMDADAVSLTKAGYNTISIHSANRNAEKQKQYIRKIREAKENVNDYDIILATSWIDVGMNFRNTNIDKLYYFIDADFKRGDFETVKQFVARPRCPEKLPVLYMTVPNLRSDERKYLNKYIQDAREKGIELKQYIFDVIYNEAVALLRKYKYLKSQGYGLHTYYESVMGEFPGIYKERETQYYKISKIAIKYEAYKQVDRINYLKGKADYLKQLFNVDVVEEYNAASIWRGVSFDQRKEILSYLSSILGETKDKDEIINHCIKLSGGILERERTGRISSFIKRITDNQYMAVRTSMGRGQHGYKIIINN